MFSLSHTVPKQRTVVSRLGQRYDYDGVSFLVTPEYGRIPRLQEIARKHDFVVIGGFVDEHGTGVVLVNKKGKVLDTRYKAMYPPFRPESKPRKTGKVRCFKFNVLSTKVIKILPLVCYEIVFPQLWMKEEFKPVDFVTHHVGFPMFDVFQYEGWRALERTASIFFNCDVIVYCGKDSTTPLNPTGVLSIGDKFVFDYKHLYVEGHTGGHI